MLIEQIIKLISSDPGPPGRSCNPKTAFFHAVGGQVNAKR